MIQHQNILNAAYAALSAQGRNSSNHDGDCFYRHPENPSIRCAIGHLIPEENYDHIFEGDSVVTTVAAAIDPTYRVDPHNLDHRNFLNALQCVHDALAHCDPANFAANLHDGFAGFAADHNLEFHA